MSAANPAPAADPHYTGPYAALKHRNCQLFMVSFFLSIISSKILMVALSWELLARTDQPKYLAWLALALGLPMLILGLPAGQLSDMYNRKRIIVASQILSLLTSVALALLVIRQSGIEWIYACVLLRGIFGTFGRPARQALFPQMVPSHAFQNAVTWNSSCFQLAIVLGPALGGLLVNAPEWHLPNGVVVSSVALAFLADAVFMAASALMTAMLQPHAAKRAAERPSLKSLVAGVHFVWNKKLILAAITLDLFAVLLGGANYLFPVYAKDIFKNGPQGLGWMESAPALGAITMALLLAHLPPMRRAGRTLLWAVAGFGAATIVFGASTNFPLALFALFMTGAFDNISVVVRNTLVQTLAPDHMRGRVSAVNSMFIGASNEMGGFESAMVAQHFGPVASVVSGGIGTILVVGMVALFWPQVGRIKKLSDLKPEPGTAAPASKEAVGAA